MTTHLMRPDTLRRICRIAAWAAWLGGFSAPLAAQSSWPRSQVGRFEVDGFDFRPNGAWRTTTDRIRQRRLGLLRRGQLGALNAQGPGAPVVTGSYLVPVVPISFANRPPPFPAAQYHDVLFSPSPVVRPYSVRTYYAEVSHGLLALDGVVLDWVTADSTDTYYEDGCNGIGVLSACPHGGQRFGELLLEALQQNNTGALDWGQFDNDGPDGVPNSGDDDGIVDFVTFLQPEEDGACGTTNIWAHRYVIRAWNGNSPFVTKNPRRNAAGVPIAGQFVAIDDYIIQSAVGGNTACDPDTIMPIGTMAHETGHAFGLPDLYDTNLGSSSVTQGIGEWGIMGSGSYSQPYSPSRMEAWSLEELGWVTVDSLTASAGIQLTPVASDHRVLYLGVPDTDEYFLLENRQAIGSDSAQLNPACKYGNRSCAKTPGLLVWHIDQGQIQSHGFRVDNRVNSGPVHGVALVQADGLNELSAPGGKDRGDPGDSYPGSTHNVRLSSATTPASLDNQGASAGFTLAVITQQANGDVVFSYTKTDPGLISVSVDLGAQAALGQTTLGSAQLRWLDSLGNDNGQYDIGDFLSLLKRSGGQASSAAVEDLLGGRRRRRS